MRLAMSILVFGGAAMALPRLEVKPVAGANFAVPAGWSVKTSVQPIPTVQIEETAGAADSPSITIMSVPPGAVAMTTNQVVQTAMPARQPVGQQVRPDGSTLQVWAGPIGGIPAKMAVLSRADPARGIGAVAVFAAPARRFDPLGGAQLLVSVVSGQAGGAAAQPVAPATPAGAQRLSIPPAYRGSNMPTLELLANDFEKMTPAQVAGGMLQLNQSERMMLGAHGAFANLLHIIGCRAEPRLTLPDGTGCAKTAAGWQQTLQLSNGNLRQATEYAQRQRASLQIAARCRNGQTDRASCAAYTRTVTAMNASQHDTMMTIIRNMNSASCRVGEPGCVPY